MLYREKYGDNRKTNYVKSAVLNLVEDDIPDNHNQLLNLGPSFVPTIKKIPYMDIIEATEIAAIGLEKNNENEKAQQLRHNIVSILSVSKNPKSNLDHTCKTAIKEIISDPTIDIYPYDKGAGFVRIKHSDALEKIEEQIGHTKISNTDPTKNFKTKVQKELRSIYKTKRLTKKLYNLLYPSDAIAPRMYGTIKAHKPEKNFPMRIIVSTVGSPPYMISKHLVDLIQPTLSKNNIRLKNSTEFVDTAKAWKIQPDEMQCSFDVVNLYPSVPIDKAIIVILELLQNDFDDLSTKTKLTLNDIKRLITLCVSVCYFKWEEKIRLLENSGPIGLSIMVVIAEAFLQRIENNAINIAINSQPNISPITYKRYVDDSHARFHNEDQANTFLDILNSQDQNIQYTIENENEYKELNFLDTTVINSTNGYYEFKVYRKDAISNVQIKPTSSVDPKIIKGVFKGFLSRAYKTCSEKYLEAEINFLIDIFVENGYTRDSLKTIVGHYQPYNRIQHNSDTKKIVSLPWIPGLSYKLKRSFKKVGLKTVFKSHKNLSNILCSRNKSKLSKLDKPGVYHIDCECEDKYVGETGCLVSTRESQHKQSIFKCNQKDSGLSEHALKCDQDVKWENNTILSVQPNWYKRKVREALEIQYWDCGPNTRHGMNRDWGDYVTTQAWKPLFSNLRKRQSTP